MGTYIAGRTLQVGTGQAEARGGTEGSGGAAQGGGERPPSSGLARGHLNLLCKEGTSTGAGE